MVFYMDPPWGGEEYYKEHISGKNRIPEGGYEIFISTSSGDSLAFSKFVLSARKQGYPVVVKLPMNYAFQLIWCKGAYHKVIMHYTHPSYIIAWLPAL